MRTVTAFRARTRFGELLERVSRGEEIIIIKYGKPVARIVPEDRAKLSGVHQAVDELFALRRRMTKRRGFKPLSSTEIREAIRNGRP